MKKLLLLWLFSCSLDGFSQDTLNLKLTDTVWWKNTQAPFSGCLTGVVLPSDWKERQSPDTIRATLVVYHDGENSLLHTMPGFVVVHYGGPHVYNGETYLDNKLQVIKYPLEVLTYKLRRAKQ